MTDITRTEEETVARVHYYFALLGLLYRGYVTPAEGDGAEDA